MPTAVDQEALQLMQEAFFTLGHPDPYPLWRRLREIAPVHYTPVGVVVLTRALCESLLRDRRLGRGDWLTKRPEYGHSPFMQSWNRMVVNLDPPVHTKVRSLVSKAFTPSVIEGLRPYVRTFIEARLAEALERGSFDLIGDLAFVLPVTIIGQLIGIPEADRAQFRGWSRTILRAMGSSMPPDEHIRAADEATTASEEYIRAMVLDRARNPRDDLASRMLLAEDNGLRLSEDEVVSNLNFLTMAGFETTMYSIGLSAVALLRHPEQLALVRGGDVDMKAATEELLRYEPPVIWASRILHEDMEIGERVVPAETAVAFVLGAANRDPDFISDPDRLDLRRADPRPISFGGGAHYCMGAALARLEIQEALAGIFTRFDVDLLDDPIEWAQVPGLFRGPAVLRLQIGQR